MKNLHFLFLLLIAQVASALPDNITMANAHVALALPDYITMLNGSYIGNGTAMFTITTINRGSVATHNSITMTGGLNYLIPPLAQLMNHSFSVVGDCPIGAIRHLYAYADFTNNITERNESNNMGFGRATCLEGPDLYVESIERYVLPNGSNPFGTTLFNITISNSGNTAAPQSYVFIDYNSSNDSIAIPLLEPSTSHTITVAYPCLPDDNSFDRRILIYADATNIVNESIEFRNVLGSNVWSCSGIPYVNPDLIVNQINLSSPIMQIGRRYNLTITTTNIGNQDVPRLLIPPYYFLTEIEGQGLFPESRLYIPTFPRALRVGHSITDNITIGCTEVGVIPIVVTSDVDNLIYEWNESNNQRTLTFRCITTAINATNHTRLISPISPAPTILPRSDIALNTVIMDFWSFIKKKLFESK